MEPCRELQPADADFLTRFESNLAGENHRPHSLPRVPSDDARPFLRVQKTTDSIVYTQNLPAPDQTSLQVLKTADSRALATDLRQHSLEGSQWHRRLDQEVIEELKKAGVLRCDRALYLLTFLFPLISSELRPAAADLAPEFTPPLASPPARCAVITQRPFAADSGGDSEDRKEALHRFTAAVN